MSYLRNEILGNIWFDRFEAMQNTVKVSTVYIVKYKEEVLVVLKNISQIDDIVMLQLLQDNTLSKGIFD
jgi:hypothetical protein